MRLSFFRKTILMALTAACLALLFCLPALADAYTIDEALQLVGTKEGRENGGMLELEGDFSQFDFYNEEYFTSDGGKTIILWREAPEKAFVSSPTEFGADYTGEDQGEPRVFLCAELMERIPEEQRAKTFAEAANILMAEVRYDISASIITTIGEETASQPSAAALDAILSGEGSGADDADEAVEYEYKPLFDCTVLTCLYNTETLGATAIDWMVFPHEELRANPEADNYWTEMMMLIELLQYSALEDEDERIYMLTECLYAGYTEDTALTEDEWTELVDLAYGNDMDALASYCWEKFWEMASLLPELDPDAAELYEEAIAQQSLEGMMYIVNACGYSDIGLSDASILIRKAYIGKPDPDVLTRLLDEAVSTLAYYDWDMARVSEEFLGY